MRNASIRFIVGYHITNSCVSNRVIVILSQNRSDLALVTFFSPLLRDEPGFPIDEITVAVVSRRWIPKGGIRIEPVVLFSTLGFIVGKIQCIDLGARVCAKDSFFQGKTRELGTAPTAGVTTLL